MGVLLRAEDTLVTELKQLRRKLVDCAGIQRRKNDEEYKRLKSKSIDDVEEKVVCVTGGGYFLGAAIIDELLLNGYTVRIIVDNPEEINKLGVIRSTGSNISVVAAKLSDVSSLMEAFNGCRGVFHTTSSIDPAGLSGYSKIMSAVEMRSTENVMEACARTASVRNCVLTSSLLACIWRSERDQHHEQGAAETETSPVVSHQSWSDLQLCQDKKLWYALGKLKSEKVAWRIAEESGLKLATICPGLITGPNFHRKNSTATMAYLKGAREMFANGLLATVDVLNVAKAHVCVYDGMRENNEYYTDRYICYDQVITSEDEAEKLAMEMGIPTNSIVDHQHTDTSTNSSMPFQLSKKKLSDLMSRRFQRCLYDNFRPIF